MGRTSLMSDEHLNDANDNLLMIMLVLSLSLKQGVYTIPSKIIASSESLAMVIIDQHCQGLAAARCT